MRDIRWLQAVVREAGRRAARRQRQLEFAEELGMGSRDYNLKRVRT